jgi:hypothetical protein
LVPPRRARCHRQRLYLEPQRLNLARSCKQLQRLLHASCPDLQARPPKVPRLRRRANGVLRQENDEHRQNSHQLRSARVVSLYISVCYDIGLTEGTVTDLPAEAITESTSRLQGGVELQLPDAAEAVGNSPHQAVTEAPADIASTTELAVTDGQADTAPSTEAAVTETEVHQVGARRSMAAVRWTTLTRKTS